MARILIKFKGSLLKEIPLQKEVTMIGRRANNDIQLDYPAVSGYHAGIAKDGKHFYIEDMKSLNGTFLNGKRLSINDRRKVNLNDGDDILIGKHNLIFMSEKDEENKIGFSEERLPNYGTMVIDSKVQQKILGKAPFAVGGLVLLQGSLDKRNYKLMDRMTSIGKHRTAGIRVRGFFTPSVAALIKRSNEGYRITPSSRRKVLKINGKKLRESHSLKDGDVIKVSGSELKFYLKKDGEG